LGLEAFVEHVGGNAALAPEQYKEPYRDLESLLQEIRDLIYDYMFQVHPPTPIPDAVIAPCPRCYHNSP
jgi:hypothetical protein